MLFTVVHSSSCDEVDLEDEDDDDTQCERRKLIIILKAVTSFDFEVFGKVQGKSIHWLT